MADVFGINSGEEKVLMAEIILPLFLPNNYTWYVPQELADSICAGIRVEVALRNKKYAGIVKRIFYGIPSFALQPVLNILDDRPILHVQQLQLWSWISRYYMCTEGEIMLAAVPANFRLSGESVLIWNDLFDDEDLTFLSDEEYLVAEALTLKKELRISEVQKILDAAHVYPIVKKLIDKQICFIWEELRERYKPKYAIFVQLNDRFQDDEEMKGLMDQLSRAPKQLELLIAYLQLIKTEANITQPVLLKRANASSAQLKSLIEKKIFRTEKRVVDRIPFAPFYHVEKIELSEAQQNAFEQINMLFSTKEVCLLHGVTSSGKTEIYIRQMELFLAQGKQILYMLPEIALTAQIINRLRKYFGNSVVVYHSKFNSNERVEIWNRVKSGEARIVLGARSALLLPFQNLGLLIVDEEHDSSYKQTEPAPRYHARDSAIFYAALFHAKVLLGSATPSLESYTNALSGKYGLVTLSERFGKTALPVIHVVRPDAGIDASEGKLAERPILSQPLKEALIKTLEAGNQAILFQNRRGYATYLQCASCGWIPECRQCKVSLTLHKHRNKLMCHYCGSEYPIVQTCPECGSHHFIQKNFGTEQIEEYLQEHFASANVARMDLDSIRGKNDHETLIKTFEKKKIDILVGTQMVVKGLDFEHVSLVGIIDADAILNFADFRVNERAFQLMEQVSGRAGRREGQGLVYIQAIREHHPILQLVEKHDYQGFYHFEMPERKAFFYPPYSRIIQLTIRHKDKSIAEDGANILAQYIAQKYGNYLTGPAEPVINKIRNQYLFNLLLKLPKDQKLISECKQYLLLQIGILRSQKKYSRIVAIADVDPV